MPVDTVTQMFARQPAMHNIVDQFHLPDSKKSLKNKEQRPRKTANAKSQNYKANLQYNISQQRILWMEKPALGTAHDRRQSENTAPPRGSKYITNKNAALNDATLKIYDLKSD